MHSIPPFSSEDRANTQIIGGIHSLSTIKRDGPNKLSILCQFSLGPCNMATFIYLDILQTVTSVFVVYRIIVLPPSKNTS